MNVDSGFRAPRQNRSRDTLERLLSATIAVLAKEGLEGATIPRIAALADVAPASVYRRFQDKDALLRAAFVRLLELSREQSAKAFVPSRFDGTPLEESVGLVIKTVMNQYRASLKLLSALRRFTDLRPEPEFDRFATSCFTENLRSIVACLSASSGNESDGFRERATLGLLTVVSALEVRALEPSSLWSIVAHRTDEELASELVRMLMGYLGAEEPTGPL